MEERVLINTEYITLGQLLKLKNIINSGGQAKYFLNENNVKVNGILDNRRGKKLFNGDKVVINQNEGFLILKKDS